MTIIDVEPTLVEIDGKPRKSRRRKSKRVEPKRSMVGLFQANNRTMMAMAELGETLINNAPGLIAGACLSLFLGGLGDDKNR